jgi:membrane-bound lytic murein transglycosylase D
MRPADAAKRVGMTESALRSVNSIPARVVIKAGSSLLVPRATHLETDVAVHLAENGQLSLASEAVAKRAKRKSGKGVRVSKAKGSAKSASRHTKHKTTAATRLAKE